MLVRWSVVQPFSAVSGTMPCAGHSVAIQTALAGWVPNVSGGVELNVKPQLCEERFREKPRRGQSLLQQCR